MFQPENNLAWLVALWTRCCSVAFLGHRDERFRLSMNYLGCNLVIHLVDELWQIAGASPFHVAGALTYHELDQWLLNAPGDGNVEDVLAGNGPRTEVLQTLSDHPWQRVHVWLLREVIIRVVNRTDDATAAFRHGMEAFQAGVPAAPDLPEHCQRRGDHVLAAFETWWRACLEGLIGLLRERGWRELRELTVDSLTRIVSLSLTPGPLSSEQPGPLTVLLRAKCNQWSACLQQRDFDLALLPGEPWFERMAGRLLDASLRVGRVVLDANDIRRMGELFRWLAGQAPQLLQGVPQPIPNEVADDAQVAIRGQELDRLQQAWDAILDWLNGQQSRVPYARDLFEQPRPMPFQNWRQHAGMYWP